ncbi:Microtubule-associated protein, microtubule dynamics during spindle orientation [Pichia californica]|nr:Microtubule-associated protein, microtubule dynamics during spindle orientation [[Candida] californica]
MSENDYESLPIDQLLEHTLWKARQLGYTQLKGIAESDASNDIIKQLISNPLRLQKLVTDSNVAAQESGIGALNIILEKSTPEYFFKTRDIIIPSLVDKGLTSTKQSTKKLSTDVILLYVEKTNSGLEIIELMIPSLSAKSPKQVASTVKAINEIYYAFGCPKIDPKIIMNHISKLFEHSDKNVRAEASNLSITIRSYIGDVFDTVIFPKIKPIQQKDLSKLFDKIDITTVKPSRLLLSDQQVNNSNNNNNDNDNDDDNDIQMNEGIITESITEKPAFDSYDFEDPVDVLSKLPTELSSRLKDPIWKERVDVLEEISPYFNVIKIQNDDYSYFISLMVGCLKDVNLQVVTLACGILLNLANGLKLNFTKYVSMLLSPLLDKTKEKKRSIIIALTDVLDACFKYSSFREILDPTIEYMIHISPQVKVESMSYLIRCMKEIKNIPSSDEIDKIMTPAIKLLQDSQVSVRNSASEVIGTLMKIIGPEKSKKYMEKVDKRHVKKVEQLCRSAIVKCGNNINKDILIIKETINSSSLKNENVPNLQQNNILIEAEEKPILSSINLNYNSSIPSKRAATSPLKENILNHKNTLTSKPLRASSSSMSNYSISTQQLQELELLRKEKIEWLEIKKDLLNELEEVKENNDSLIKNVVSLNSKLDDYHNKFTTMSMTLKSKDTQIFRLRSDLENCQIKYSQSQQKNKILKSQIDLSNANRNAENAEKDKTKTINVDDNEINKRISILSIESDEDTKKDEMVLKLPDASIYNFDDADDGWKRATAVTNDLKAKIQRMKARTRVLDLADD